jgi:hypothetical protein
MAIALSCFQSAAPFMSVVGKRLIAGEAGKQPLRLLDLG